MTEINDEKRKIKMELKLRKQKILKNSKAIELGLLQKEIEENNKLRNTRKN